jgi:hypothetical protein
MADPFSPEPSRATSRAASRASRSPSDVLPDRSAHPPSAIQRTASLTSGVQPLRKRQQREPFTLLVFNDLVLLLGAHKDRTSVFKVRKERPRFRAVSASEGGVGTVDSVRETKDAATGDRAFALAVRAPRPAPLGAPSHASFVLVPPAQRVRPAPELGPALDTIEGTLAVLVAARREREADSGEWDLC